jgi:hypothetical protein
MKRPKMIALGVPSIARYPTTLESPPSGLARSAIALCVVRSYFRIRVRSNASNLRTVDLAIPA